MFIHLIRTNSNTFLFMVEEYSLVYMYHNLFIHSSVDYHLGCFHVLAIINSTAKNNGIHVSFPSLVFSGYMPRSGTAGSYGGFEGRNGNPLQYSCLENPTDRGSWQAIVYTVASIRHDLATKEREWRKGNALALLVGM